MSLSDYLSRLSSFKIRGKNPKHKDIPASGTFVKSAGGSFRWRRELCVKHLLCSLLQMSHSCETALHGRELFKRNVFFRPKYLHTHLGHLAFFLSHKCLSVHSNSRVPEYSTHTVWSLNNWIYIFLYLRRNYIYWSLSVMWRLGSFIRHHIIMIHCHEHQFKYWTCDLTFVTICFYRIYTSYLLSVINQWRLNP